MSGKAPQEQEPAPEIPIDDRAYYERLGKSVQNGVIVETMADSKLVAWASAQKPTDRMEFPVRLDIKDTHMLGTLRTSSTLGEGSLTLPYEVGIHVTKDMLAMTEVNQKFVGRSGDVRTVLQRMGLEFRQSIYDYDVSTFSITDKFTSIDILRIFDVASGQAGGWRTFLEFTHPFYKETAYILSAVGFADNLAHQSGGKLQLSPLPQNFLSK